MQQSAWQQAGFGQYLETITDTHYVPATISKLDNFLHDRRKAGNSTRPQVIAEGETSGQNYKIYTLQIVVFMPQPHNLLAHYIFKNVDDIFITIRAGKYYYAEFHATKLI